MMGEVRAPCCSVGARADVAAIDEALRGGSGLGAASKRFGVPRPSLGKHRLRCLGIRVEQQMPSVRPRTTSTSAASWRETATIQPTLNAVPSLPASGLSPFLVENPDDDPQTAPRRLISAITENRCVEMRARGKSYKEIATALGVSEDCAIDAVERALIRVRRNTAKFAEQVLQKQRAAEAAGVVYFVRHGSDGPIKIGKTREDPGRRVGCLQTGNPVPLVLLAVVPGYSETEAQLHERFAEHRIAGEWFRAAPELLAFIDGARMGAGEHLPRAAAEGGAAA